MKNPLLEIARKISGSHCERLVRQTGNELAVDGASFGIAGFKFDMGHYSNTIKEFYKVPKIIIALDNTQYLLCGAIATFKDDPILREDCQKMRMQLIYAFGQLQALLCIPTGEELEKEITKWVKFMNKLNKHSIEYLRPGPRMIKKGGVSDLSKIMKYQGLEEESVQEALNVLK